MRNAAVAYPSKSHVSQRTLTKTNAYRFIYGKHDSPHGDEFKRQLQRNGSYAVTNLTLRLEDPEYTEHDLDCFIDSFSIVCPLYMNLKHLHIAAPYSVIKGATIENLMQLDSCFNDLHLDAWTFHSPIDDQWKGNQLEKLEITLRDGIAFPYAFPHILNGMSKHQASLKTVHLSNKSPHRLLVNKHLLPSRAYAHVHGIQLEENRIMPFLF